MCIRDRPQSLLEQNALFQTLGSSSCLPISYRAYCRIVCAYRAAELDDPSLIRDSLDALNAMSLWLEEDPRTNFCRQKNRINRTKLLVSTYAATLRLRLITGDRAGAARLGRRALFFSNSLELTCIGRDASFLSLIHISEPTRPY